MSPKDIIGELERRKKKRQEEEKVKAAAKSGPSSEGPTGLRVQQPKLPKPQALKCLLLLLLLRPVRGPTPLQLKQRKFLSRKDKRRRRLAQKMELK